MQLWGAVIGVKVSGAEQWRSFLQAKSASGHNGALVLAPAAVGHVLAAVRLRGFPEGDLLEAVEAVVLAALLAA
ncbi:MAG: hypothetical protein ACI9EB_001059 [Pseudomonas sp.]|jgi:hypothetical protein